MMEYTQEEFEECYNKIYDSLTKDGIAQQQNCVIFLGGQPGAGKSHFIGQDEFINYIKSMGMITESIIHVLKTLYHMTLMIWLKERRNLLMHV